MVKAPRWLGQSSSWERGWSSLLGTFTTNAWFARNPTFSPNGNLIATVDFDGIKIWKTGPFKLQKTIAKDEGSFEEVKFCSCSKRIVSSGWGANPLRMWDLETGECVETWSPPHSHGWDIIGLPSTIDHLKTILIRSEYTGKLKQWDVEAGTISSAEPKHHCGARPSLSPDGKSVASQSHGNTHLKYWSAATGKRILQPSKHLGNISTITFSSDSTQVIIGFARGAIVVWEPVADTTVEAQTDSESDVTALAASSNENMLASGHADGRIYLHNLGTCQGKKLLAKDAGRIETLVISPSSQHLVSASTDGVFRFFGIEDYDSSRDQSSRCLLCPTTVTFSPSCERIAIGSRCGRVQLRDSRTRDVTVEWQAQENDVGILKFSPDGSRLATASECYRHEWQRDQGHWNSGYGFSQDTYRWARTSYNGILRLWNTADGELIREFKAASSEILTCTFSQDGNLIVALLDDEPIQAVVYDTRTGAAKAQARLRHGEQPVVTLVSPNNHEIAFGYGDGNVFLWDMEKTTETLGLWPRLVKRVKLRDLICQHFEGGLSTLKYSTIDNSLSIAAERSTVHEERSTGDKAFAVSNELSGRGRWIYCGSLPLILLPLGYEVQASGARGDNLAIICNNGIFWVIRIRRYLV